MLQYIPINWGIFLHPSNWAIVLLMMLIAGFVLDIALSNIESGDSKELSSL